MTMHPARAICAHCNQTMPRAAFFRCPFCHEAIVRDVAGVDIICRRCNKTIPRAHAGHCPCNTVEERTRNRARARERRAQ